MALSERVLESELMDSPDLDADSHRHALSGLRRVNLLSGTGSKLARAILRFTKESDQPLKILDLACGSGDVSISVARTLAQAGRSAHVTGWDRSPVAVAVAQEQSDQLRHRDLSASMRGNWSADFLQRDVLELDGTFSFDVVMCTLFLHHLDKETAQQVLLRMHAASKQLTIIDDLRRTWLGLRLAQIGCQLLTRSHIVHVDGPMSVRAAFTEREVVELSRSVGLPDPQWQRHWPQRFLMYWCR